jgi:succinate dehydrogenase/fumarate reductase flavoprotein subunit
MSRSGLHTGEKLRRSERYQRRTNKIGSESGEGKRIMISPPGVVPVETDVLIIGGGLAGCMAAIRASEHGVRVTIAEKSNTLSSGQAGSGIDHIWAYIPEVHGKMGWTIEDLVEDHVQGIGHGFADRRLLHFIASESYNRVLDVERFGLKIRYDDSQLPGKFRIVHQFHAIPSALNVDGRSLKVILTKEARRRGVTIINRITMTDLITSDGAIAGATGVGTRDGKIYVFKAKGVVLCSGGKTGRLGREPTGIDFNLHLPANLCGDGKAMALHAGLPIINMEFLSPRRFGVANYDISGGAPRNTWQPAASVVDAAGATIVPRTSFYQWGDLEKGYQISADETRRAWLDQRGQLAASMPTASSWHEAGPFYLDCTQGTEEEIHYIEWSLSNEGKCHQFLKHLREEGVDLRKDKLELGPLGREMGNLSCAGLIVDDDLETEIKGLFAAGDEVGGTPFTASTGALTMGWRCGDVAGRRARQQDGLLPTDGDKVESLRQLCVDLLTTEQGYHWREVGYALQNAMENYCGEVRTGSMLKRGLEHLRNIKSMPLKAANPHELGRCLEVRFLLENGEMVMAASLAREESRKHPTRFCRKDFPEQDDENWLTFSTVKLENNQLKVSKLPI